MNMYKKTVIIIALLALVAIPAFAKRGNKVTIAGSTTVLPIAQSCAEEFMNCHPDVNISVRGGGSSVGIASIIAGTVDIGDASRHIKDKELVQAREMGINPVENVVANDGIVVIVNPANSIKALSLDQVKDIYTGKFLNWKEIGGPNMPIVVISRDVSSGTFEVFKEKVMQGTAGIDGALMLASNNAVVSTVASTPGAIGYAGLGYVTSSIKVLSIEGVMPSKKTIQSGEYPISRTLHMYTNGKAKGNVKLFLDFVLSPAGQKIVEAQGFVRAN